MQVRTVGSVLAMLREMQKWGFSLIQARSAKDQNLDDQIAQARVVARQLLGLEADVVGAGVDDVAHGILDVSARTARDGGFVERERRWNVAVLDIRLWRGPDSPAALAQAVETCNERVRREGLDVINVETVYASGLFGFGQRPVSLRIWHRV